MRSPSTAFAATQVPSVLTKITEKIPTFLEGETIFMFDQNYRKKFVAPNRYTMKLYLKLRISWYLFDIINISILLYKFG